MKMGVGCRGSDDDRGVGIGVGEVGLRMGVGWGKMMTREGWEVGLRMGVGWGKI